MTKSFRRWVFLAIPVAIVLCLYARIQPNVSAVFPLHVHQRSEISFIDITQSAGLSFRHWNGEKGISTIAEQAGPGCAFFDFDGDGNVDIYLVNGRDRYGRGIVARNALYRNQGGDSIQFEDATLQSGLSGTGYGMGCVAADYDNDGCVDVFVSQWGKNALYRNNGDGTFTDVTDIAKVGAQESGPDRIHTGAAFGDYDGDGNLDLYVCSYVNLRTGPRYCFLFNRIKTNCPPQSYDGTADTLYHNRGDGTFEDATRNAGVFKPHGKGLVPIWSDFYERGRPDLFVSNDGHEAYLFQNMGNGKFVETALEAGVAFAENGDAMAAMGTDRGDFDNDMHLDLLIADFQKAPNRLFRWQKKGQFQEVSFISGLGPASLNTLGFGAGFVDVDNDGWQDVFVANGHVYPEIDQLRSGEQYAQPNQLFHNLRNGKFQDITKNAGAGMRVVASSRGMAIGDIDNDGRMDLLIANVNTAPTLLHNTSRGIGNYVRLRLVGASLNRDAFGALVKVKVSGQWRVRELRSGGSYLSHSDSIMHFGLGNAREVEEASIVWPGRQEQALGRLQSNSTYQIRQP